MTLTITLTVSGSDTGPFDLYSNVDSYTSAFATGVARATLISGYTSSSVPDWTNVVRIQSTGTCTNYVDVPVTTTTTTTVAPTTTTTTTV